MTELKALLSTASFNKHVDYYTQHLITVQCAIGLIVGSTCLCTVQNPEDLRMVKKQPGAQFSKNLRTNLGKT